MRCALILLFCLTRTVPIAAENWPGWRGPRGDGTSREVIVPSKWDGTTGKNIVWKVPVPGVGHASPIVWENSIFLPSCLEETHERVLICYDRVSGEKRWQKVVLTAPLEKKHKLNSFASSTPVTDGETVFVTFLEATGETVATKNVGKPRPVTSGKIVVAAYDFDGNQRWITRPGEFASVHGFCSSPVLFEGNLIVNGDHDGDSYIIALNKATGEAVWKTPREKQTRSYCTPLIREVDGKPQMVLSGSHRITSFDPRNGRRLWWVEGPAEQFVATMVYDGKTFYMAAGFPTHHVMAINPGGSGDVTNTHVDWHVTSAKCYVPSPVLVGNQLLVADDRGTGNGFDIQTGERLWQARLGRHFSASLVTDGVYGFFTADDGMTSIIFPDKEHRLVRQNPLGQFTYASPAISQGHIYMRGTQHLFAIGPGEPKE